MAEKEHVIDIDYEALNDTNSIKFKDIEASKIDINGIDTEKWLSSVVLHEKGYVDGRGNAINSEHEVRCFTLCVQNPELYKALYLKETTPVLENTYTPYGNKQEEKMPDKTEFSLIKPELLPCYISTNKEREEFEALATQLEQIENGRLQVIFKDKFPDKTTQWIEANHVTRNSSMFFEHIHKSVEEQKQKGELKYDKEYLKLASEVFNLFDKGRAKETLSQSANTYLDKFETELNKHNKEQFDRLLEKHGEGKREQLTKAFETHTEKQKLKIENMRNLIKENPVRATYEMAKSHKKNCDKFPEMSKALKKNVIDMLYKNNRHGYTVAFTRLKLREYNKEQVQFQTMLKAINKRAIEKYGEKKGKEIIAQHFSNTKPSQKLKGDVTGEKLKAIATAVVPIDKPVLKQKIA